MVGYTPSTNGSSFVNPVFTSPSFTGQMLGPNGTVGAPAYSFTSTPNDGMWYNAASTRLAFSTAGTERFYITDAGAGQFTSSLGVTSNFTVNGQLTVTSSGSGSSSNIALALDSTGNTGLYAPSANNLSLVTNKVVALTFDNAQNATMKNVQAGFGSLAQLAFAVGSNNYGLCFTGGLLTVADGGAAALQFDGSQNATFTKMLKFKSATATKTTAYTVLATDSGSSFTTTGSAAQVVFTLPAAVAGLFYTFVSDNAFGAQLKANGTDVIKFPSSASSAGGTQTTTTDGGAVTIECITAGKWNVTSGVAGSWAAA